MGHSRAKHADFGRKGRLVALVAGVGGVAAATVMIVGSAGAHQTQAVAVKVTAKRVSARAVSPAAKVVDVATIAQTAAAGKAQPGRHSIPFLCRSGLPA